MRILTALLAHRGGADLPRAALEDLGGTTVAERVLRRLEACPEVDEVAVLMGEEEEEELRGAYEPLGRPLVTYAAGNALAGIDAALARFRSRAVLIVDGLSPLFPRESVTRLVAELLDRGGDVAWERGAPPGADLALVRTSAMTRAARHAETAEEGRNPVGYLLERGDEYQLLDLEAPSWLAGQAHSLRIDGADRLAALRPFFRADEPAGPATREVVEALRRSRGG